MPEGLNIEMDGIEEPRARELIPSAVQPAGRRDERPAERAGRYGPGVKAQTMAFNYGVQ
jgi:hypothetical protein